MSFISTKHKLITSFENSIRTHENLRKKQNHEQLYQTDSFHKVPVILYDSGWITALPIEHIVGG